MPVFYNTIIDLSIVNNDMIFFTMIYNLQQVLTNPINGCRMVT